MNTTLGTFDLSGNDDLQQYTQSFISYVTTDAVSLGNESSDADIIIHFVKHYGWPEWFYWTYAIYNLLAEIISLPIQGAVFLTIILSNKLRSKPQYFLIANVALGDIMWILVLTPVFVTSFYGEKWYFGDVLCQLSGFVCYMLAFQTMMSHLFIGLDRYQAIVGAIHYAGFVTKKKYMIMCVMTWVYPAIVAFPPLIGWNRYKYEVDSFGCHQDWYSTNMYDSAYILFTGIVLFYPCFVITLVLYYIIYYTAKKLVNNQPTVTISNSSGTIEQKNQLSQLVTNIKKQLRVAKLLCFMFLMFFGCYVPFVACRSIERHGGFTNGYLKYANPLSQLLFTLPHYLNPLVYCFMNREFRYEFIYFWKIRRCSVSNTTFPTHA